MMSLAAVPIVPARAHARQPPRAAMVVAGSPSPCPGWRTRPRSSPTSSRTRTTRSAPGSSSGRSRRGRRPRRLLALVVLAGGCFVRPAPSSRCSRPRSSSPAAGLWVTGPRGRRASRATGRAATRSARSSSCSARSSSSTASSCSTCTEWQVTTEYCKNRMVDLGPARRRSRSRSGSGSLPVIGGLVSLRPPRAAGRSRLSRVRRLDGGGDPLRLALHRRQGGVPLDGLRDALGGAEPDLPLRRSCSSARRSSSSRGGSTGGCRRRRGGSRPRASSCSRRSSSADPYFEAPGSAIAAARSTAYCHWDVARSPARPLVALGAVACS